MHLCYVIAQIIIYFTKIFHIDKNFKVICKLPSKYVFIHKNQYEIPKIYYNYLQCRKISKTLISKKLHFWAIQEIPFFYYTYTYVHATPCTVHTGGLTITQYTQADYPWYSTHRRTTHGTVHTGGLPMVQYTHTTHCTVQALHHITQQHTICKGED